MRGRSLKSCILESLTQYQNQVLLEDDHCSWTGARLVPYLHFLSQRIESVTNPQSRVGICFHNSAAQAIAVIATILSGRVPLIINSVDLIENKIDWIRESKLNFLIIAEELASLTQVPHLVLNNEGFSISLEGKTNLHAQLEQVLYCPPDGTGLVLFTSGSTGQPKEIYIPESGILKVAKYLIDHFDLDHQTVAAVALPICHSMAMNTQFLPTLISGGLSRFYNLRLSMNRLFREILRDEPTFLALIGEVVRTCWDEKKKKNLQPCQSVRHIQLAGGLITQRHLEMARELFPKARIHKGYGLTEAIRVTMLDDTDSHFASSAVGRPLGFIDIQIRDENKLEVPIGQRGEVFVKGPTVMLGYRTLTSSNPIFFDKDQYLATGDIGVIDSERYLHIDGRSDSLFKINGRRVSGLEIEKCAMDASEMFRFAKAILVFDSIKHRPQIILFIELDRDLWTDEKLRRVESIFTKLVENLKTLTFQPKEIIFTRALPRTSNGKLNLPQLNVLWNERTIYLKERETLKNVKFFSVMEGEK